MLTGLQKIGLMGAAGLGLFLASRRNANAATGGSSGAGASTGSSATGGAVYDPYTGSYYDPATGQYIGGGDGSSATGGSSSSGGGSSSSGGSTGSSWTDRATQSAERWASPVRGTESIWRLQNMLFDLGYDPGPLDGRWGVQTRNASVDLARALGVSAPTSATAAWLQRVEDVWASSGGVVGGSGGSTGSSSKGGAYDAGTGYYDDASASVKFAGLEGLDGYNPRAAIAGEGRYRRRY